MSAVKAAGLDAVLSAVLKLFLGASAVAGLMFNIAGVGAVLISLVGCGCGCGCGPQLRMRTNIRLWFSMRCYSIKYDTCAFWEGLLAGICEV